MVLEIQTGWQSATNLIITVLMGLMFWLGNRSAVNANAPTNYYYWIGGIIMALVILILWLKVVIISLGPMFSGIEWTLLGDKKKTEDNLKECREAREAEEKARQEREMEQPQEPKTGGVVKKVNVVRSVPIPRATM